MKECSKCKEKKELNQFTKNKREKDGLNRICKICKKEYNLKYKDKIQEYRDNNKEKQKDLYKKWKKENPGKYKFLYDKNNRKKSKQKIKEDNLKQKEYKAQWNKNQYNSNPTYKISQLTRIRILDALKGKTNKTNKTLELLGCSFEELKLYLEQQFLPEMTWDNHGEIWEIDHIEACANFNLIEIEEQKKCFHYTNLQPLFKTTEIAESFGYKNHIGNKNKHKN